MPGPLDDNDYVENLARGGRGGRGPTGQPGGTGPAGLAGSLGYGAGGGLGQGGAYGAAGGYARRRRRPVGGYTGQPAQDVEGALGVMTSSMPMRSMQPVAEQAPVTGPRQGRALAAGSGGAMGRRLRDLADRGVRDGIFPGAPGAPQAPTDNLDIGPEFDRAIREWIRGGGLSPGGSEAEMEAIRGEVRRANSAGRARARNRARLSAGGDPQATAFADILSEVQGNRALSDGMASARAGIGDRQARMLAALFGRGVENDMQWKMNDQRAALGRRAQDQQDRGGLGGFLGDIGGSIIGGIDWADLLWGD